MSGIATAEPPAQDCIDNPPPPDTLCTCRVCKAEKPIEAFRITSKRTGKRDTRCRTCYNAYARKMAQRYNRRRRERRRRLLAGKLADARTRYTFEEIGNALIAACGGLEQFTVYWHEHLQAVTREKPGSYHAFRLHGAMMNLLMLANGHPSLASMEDAARRSRPVPKGEPTVEVEDDRPSFEMMSDAELHEILRTEHEARRSGRGVR